MDKDQGYIDIVTEYKTLSKEEETIKARKEELRLRAAELLHREKMNEKLIALSEEEKWRICFQDRTTLKTDLKILMEMVGPKKYGEIVRESTSTFLVIRKAGKDKTKSDLTTSKPVDDTPSKPGTPGGIILT